MWIPTRLYINMAEMKSYFRAKRSAVPAMIAGLSGPDFENKKIHTCTQPIMTSSAGPPLGKYLASTGMYLGIYNSS